MITSSSQQGSEQRTISGCVLDNPVNVLYLFQCFQEAQDDEWCKILSKSFNKSLINVSHNSLLPHQVMSLGFFLSRSHRKWKELHLWKCIIEDHGMNIVHQYVCGDEANKQKITKIITTSLEHHHISLLTSSDTFSHTI